ncbi:hypothetical protein [Levilactobacillus namurensis]|uniref:DUF2479 domain-containing protein n=1 Tax=Levilactobacillus namurensis TaxID=380393 RepID=A0AAW8W974_9LACO|nr:hypothetical protein [Levilactobacillus namurensis]MDT7015129.1 hypothetical protein [Levilactobacillus namurensis]MDT7015308.1 hypothetical protein [Levilactobacillus namurensis]MDT7015564.1 hypothetical protein [Levilactobacillus namurensis]
MLTYYVKTDEETGYILEVKTVATEGYTEIYVLPSSREWFTRYYSHYKVENSVAKPTDSGLPDLSVDYLKAVIDQQAEQLIEANKSIDKASTTITTLQSLAGTLTGQVTKANQTIDSLQKMAGSLTGQIAQLKLAQTTFKEG